MWSNTDILILKQETTHAHTHTKTFVLLCCSCFPMFARSILLRLFSAAGCSSLVLFLLFLLILCALLLLLLFYYFCCCCCCCCCFCVSPAPSSFRHPRPAVGAWQASPRAHRPRAGACCCARPCVAARCAMVRMMKEDDKNVVKFGVIKKN